MCLAFFFLNVVYLFGARKEKKAHKNKLYITKTAVDAIKIIIKNQILINRLSRVVYITILHLN